MLLHNSRSMSLYNQRSILKVSGTVMNEWEVSEKNKNKIVYKEVCYIFFLNSVFWIPSETENYI